MRRCLIALPKSTERVHTLHELHVTITRLIIGKRRPSAG